MMEFSTLKLHSLLLLLFLSSHSLIPIRLKSSSPNLHISSCCSGSVYETRCCTKRNTSKLWTDIKIDANITNNTQRLLERLERYFLAWNFGIPFALTFFWRYFSDSMSLVNDFSRLGAQPKIKCPRKYHKIITKPLLPIVTCRRFHAAHSSIEPFTIIPFTRTL